MIPHIIHHVWPGSDPFRPEFHAFRSSWLVHHPDWSFFFWRFELTGMNVRVENADVARVLDDRSYSVVVKSDLLRLYALERFGGIYVDTDFECLKPLDELLEASCFCGMETESFACPSLLAAEPHHPFIKALLEKAVERVKTTSVEDCNRRPNEITGPHLLTAMLQGRTDVVAHPPRTFYPRDGGQNAYAKHHWNGETAQGWRHRATFSDSVYTRSSGIPKIIHHVWPGRDHFRSEFHAWRRSWMKHHPDWTLMFHRMEPTGDSRVDAIIADGRFTTVLKSDVLRLSVLNRYGGIYVDTDFECYRPFDELLPSAGFFCAHEPTVVSGIHTGGLMSPALMGAVPDHPFVKHYLEEAIKAVHSTATEQCNWKPNTVTGPHLMQRVAAGHRDVTVHPASWYYPEADPKSANPYARHHWNTAFGPQRGVLQFGLNSTMRRPGDEEFQKWYAPGGMGSGPGSTVEYTVKFRSFLENFMRTHNIRTIVDYGCGDWQWARLVEWQGRVYSGYDIVPELVARLSTQHGMAGVRSFSVIQNPDTFEPPDADLIICKDVLQHLPTSEAKSLIARFTPHAKHILWINDRSPDPTRNNGNTHRGGYRHLDLSRPPFSLAGKTVFEFEPSWHADTKIVFWQQR